MFCTTLAFALVALGPAFAVAAAAQERAPATENQAAREQEPSKTVTISLDQLLKAEVDTIEGASRYRQNVTDAPASVTIVTSEEIERFGYRTLADILRSVRGFYVTYDRNYTYLGVRGFARPGDYNTRVLFLLDGHRLNDNVYDAVLIGTDFPLDVELIDRVEVIRGPTSTAYGTNAFFGVVNIITKRAASVGRLTAAVEGGSLETGRVRATGARAFAGGGELVVSASGYRSSGQKAIDYPDLGERAEDLDDDQAWSVFASARRGAWRVLAAGNGRTKEIPTGAFGVTFTDHSESVDERALVSVAFDKAIGRTSVQWRAGYDWMGYDGTWMYADGVNVDYSRGSWLSASATLSRRVGKRHFVSGGYDWRGDIRQEQVALWNGEVDVDSHESKNTRGGWIADEFSLSDKLLLYGAVSHEDFGSFGHSTNVRTAAILKPATKTAIKLLHGTAFRAPNAYELYYYSGYRASLVPEKVRTSELVVERQVGGAVKLTAAAFHSRSRELITMVSLPGEDEYGFENVDVARTRGVEVEADARIFRRLSGVLAYTYQSAELETSGERLTNAPAHLLQGHVRAPLGPVTVGVEAIHVGRRLTVGGGSTDASTLTNVTATTTELSKRIRVSLGVQNLFDVHLLDPAGEEHPQPTIRQDGRTVRLKVIWAF